MPMTKDEICEVLNGAHARNAQHSNPVTGEVIHFPEPTQEEFDNWCDAMDAAYEGGFR